MNTVKNVSSILVLILVVLLILEHVSKWKMNRAAAKQYMPQATGSMHFQRPDGTIDYSRRADGTHIPFGYDPNMLG